MDKEQTIIKITNYLGKEYSYINGHTIDYLLNLVFKYLEENGMIGYVHLLDKKQISIIINNIFKPKLIGLESYKYKSYTIIGVILFYFKLIDIPDNTTIEELPRKYFYNRVNKYL